jgi:hypothetical protein
LPDIDAELEQFAMNPRCAQSGLARLTSWISWRISSDVFGRPPRGVDFQRHHARKPARCQRITVSGFTMVRAFNVLGATR